MEKMILGSREICWQKNEFLRLMVRSPRFSNLLLECRVGQLSYTNYDFLNGYPTSCAGSIIESSVGLEEPVNVSHCECPECENINCDNFSANLKDSVQNWFGTHSAAEWDVVDFWNNTHSDFECCVCRNERKRRARVIHRQRACGMTLEEARDILNSERFQESVLITEYNRPVTLYAQRRSQLFARTRKQQLFWIQARDTPPAEHFGEYSTEELQQLKRTWLGFHGRKTEGVLSLFPCTYDLPSRITNGRGKDCREFKIHNGAKCRIKAWQLHPEDAEKLRNCNDEEVVLKHLPLVLFVEMEGEDRKQYPGLPKNWFPLRPTTLYWNLDKDDYISIARLGFPLVPNFSSTIHCATGQTLKSIIPDLGDVKDVPTPTVAMKGYIGLSRTTDAEGVLIARPFSPLLFQQGPQAHATALLDIMRRNSDKPEAVHRRLMEMETSRTQRLLRSEVWKCIICEKQKADCCMRWHDCMISLKSGMIRFNHAKKWHDWLKQSACGNEHYPKPCLVEKKTAATLRTRNRQRSEQKV